MSESQRTGVIALYDRLPTALADFDKLGEFSTNLVVEVPFDAAVASKDEAGRVKIVKEHVGLRAHLARHGAGTGLAVGLLASLLPSVGPEALAAGVAAGGTTGEVASLQVDHARHQAIIEAADQALDRGESLLCVVCSPSDAEQFDQWLNSAQRVVQIDLEDTTAPGA